MPRAKGREPLTRDRIVAAALRLVDERGLEALTMRRLGAALGVDPMALYYHVDGKPALVRLLVEAVYADLASSEAGEGAGDWRERVRGWARAYRDRALAHPNLVLPLLADLEAVAAASAHADPPLRAAVGDSGLPPAEVGTAGDLVVDYVHGYVLGMASAPAVNREAGRATAEAGFEAALDLVIAGIEAQARRPRGRRRPR